MLQAVFFDFDGVIADTEPLHLRAYQQVLGAEGIELTREDYYTHYLGYDDAGLFQVLARDRRLAITTGQIDDWVDAKSQVIDELISSGLVLFPGAADCVRMFAERVPLAIASGALEPEIVRILESAGLRGCFRAIASASDGVRGKPAPDLYMLAMAKIHDGAMVNPASCLAIEDSHWGLDAARQAGLRCIAVTNTYPASELSQADLVVERLSDLSMSKVEGLMRDNTRAAQ